GIVHRDLKPLNIMICNDKPNVSQAVKILDFGLAKIKSGELLGSFIQAQTTGLMGSPFYMAPEQWADDDPDARSDIYSLGVMLFQMLTGDVPFKGSSIPAIMKKHISDPAPTFAELGIELPPELELAVRHTLQKEKGQRTPSVEAMIAELREAIYPLEIGIHTTSGTSMPVSSLNIRTKPPRAKVFVDNFSVGESRQDGWITLNGLQSGSHLLRVSHDGWPDWTGEVYCDGRTKQVVADLTSAAKAPGDSAVGQNTPHRMASTQDAAYEMQNTVVHGLTTGSQIGVESDRPKRSYFTSPLVLAGMAIVGLLIVLGAAGLGGAFIAGLLNPKPINSVNSASSSSVNSAAPTSVKADMVMIPGGQFSMGRDDGPENERPRHTETVKPFYMDKTEVTNSEYYDFVKATGYKEVPAHWENARPVSGQENMPVRYVNIDDISAFIKWRSQRDGVTYRLPTEQEWEFAARNGSKSTLYPWGDRFESRCAVVDQDRNDPHAVGTYTCPNDWQVKDLIGNVIEWTSSPAWLYPGSKGKVIATVEPKYMVRGGSAMYRSTGTNAITSTFRLDAPGSMRNAALGFRLVRPQ
ncbi:MAG: SUMF1/EgtB/PvdO family nonheme iron enzyme, partial [Acidobacteria bacterium]|nr:SUMF1/EgtB/PvdO family nonheme iron enzyme [Acidobacteriota bacterium]